MYEKRWRKIKEKIDDENFDAFVVRDNGNIRYLCCSDVPSFPLVSCVVIPRKGKNIAIASSLEEFRARDKCAIKNLRIFCPYPGIKSDGKNLDGVLGNVLKKINAKKILSDTRQKIKNVKLRQDDFVFKMRMKKDKEEIRRIRKACMIADYGAKILGEIIDERKTELQVANELDCALRGKGAQCNSFPTIIASGRNSSYSHHDNTNKKLGNGMVICDFGVYYEGYCSDITRTMPVGNVSEKMIDVYNLVLEAQEKAIKKIKVGKKFAEIDKLIREIFREYGYDRYFVHSTGHGIGLEVHEKPGVACNAKGRIEKGNVFTVEPGIYLPKKFGVRIEDDLLVGENVEVLTKAKKKL
ncbi:MAG: aminopeptidase P family protein [Candidatus Thermoplasmatota archaeon]|nr:aminopeptidase P family protein [Candidatus Thermoplasmatota archaeon]